MGSSLIFVLIVSFLIFIFWVVLILKGYIGYPTRVSTLDQLKLISLNEDGTINRQLFAENVYQAIADGSFSP